MNQSCLNNKEIVKNLLLHLPDETSLHQIASEIEFIAAIRQGITELDSGYSIEIETVERDLPLWIIE